LAEFTGERLIPGQVDIDLFNEHMARYTFAVRLARGKRVLDAGCGSGYGSLELARVAQSVTGVDVAAEAVEFARENYSAPNLTFDTASVNELPYGNETFDLVVAFEVIEHLEDWRGFLAEARRVLSPSGQLIVSTPNRLYYTESRGAEGSNPFHIHEFDFAEFRAELKGVFPFVSMFLENHVEGVAFQPFEPENTVEARVDRGDPAPDDSHFFVAVCAHRPQIGNPTFVYVPRSANVLRERERHISALEQERALKDEWLQKAQQELAEFDRQYREQKEALERSNRWAEELNALVTARDGRIGELQAELAADQANARRVIEGYNAKIAALEQENREKTDWAIDTERRLSAEIERLSAELTHSVAELNQASKDLEERTAWALRLDSEKAQVEKQLSMVRMSRWVKLGRKVGLGPAL
jgi:SAM-dependent methyltransferase